MPGLTDNTALLPDDPKTYTSFAGYRIQVASLEPQPTAGGASRPATTPAPRVESTVALLVSAAP